MYTGPFVVHSCYSCVFSSEEAHNFREIYFDLKKGLKSLTHYSCLINTICSYLHESFDPARCLRLCPLPGPETVPRSRDVGRKYLFIPLSGRSRVLSCPGYFLSFASFFIKSKIPATLTLIWPPSVGSMCIFITITNMGYGNRIKSPALEITREGEAEPRPEACWVPLSESFQGLSCSSHRPPPN